MTMKGLARMPLRSRARWSVWINLAVFPGLGSIFMGRRAGWAQAALMLAGFGLTMTFFLWYLWCCVLYLHRPAWDQSQFAAQYLPLTWTLRYGLLLCAVAWLWALATSIGIWRKAANAME